MIIVRLIGGLGNQMFQYAFALVCKELFPQEEIKIDVTAFKGYPLHEGYQIEKLFGAKLSKASKKEILKLNYPFFHYRLWQIGKNLLPMPSNVKWEKKEMVYDDTVFEHNSDVYYEGYWQCEEYFSRFKSLILKSYIFPSLDKKNSRFISKYKNQEIVSLHIRRGDYLKNPLFKGLTELNYYRDAIIKIMSQANIDKFIVFSNDIEWCKKNIIPICDGKCVFVDWNKGEDSFRDMQLMSLCNHNIIANSSFSWWGAWLNQNPDKIVIAPKKWINRISPTDIVPKSWLKI